VQVHVGDLILNSRHSGSNDVEADNERGTNGNLGLGAKGLVFIYTQNPDGDHTVKVWFANNGNVGIGTNKQNPEQKLEVEGNIVAEDVRLSGGDCAEEFEIEQPDTVGPGSVLVIGNDERLRQCTERYDKRVAGVISGAGDCKPAILLGRRDRAGVRLPLALTGRVFCKVDATYSGVGIGDLLTTSETPGYAMKASDVQAAQGSILGKALRPLAEGRGLIPILVTLR
jgi:hypothetical protein